MNKLLITAVITLMGSGVMAKDYYILTLKCYKHEVFSFNLKNERNAIIFDIPVEKEFYDSVKPGQRINQSSVYSSCISIIPRLFENLNVEVKNKKVVSK